MPTRHPRLTPAIKRRFLYATGCKAWRADSRQELFRRFRQAANLIEPSEVIVQELVPGSGRAQLSYWSHGLASRLGGSLWLRTCSGTRPFTTGSRGSDGRPQPWLPRMMARPDLA